MTAVDIQDTTRLRDTLREVPEYGAGYGAWWGTDDGQWLHAMINDLIGVPVVKQVRRLYDASYESSDVANNAVAALSQNFVRAAVQRADDPWAYLYTTLKRELSGQAGRFFRTEMSEDITIANIESDSHGRTNITEAIHLTAACLREITPKHLIPGMNEAVFFFAEHGHSRLSHLFTASTHDGELATLGLARHHILAIANAVLGSRPNHSESSILAGFLIDESWDPRASVPHRRALEKYAARITKPTTLTLIPEMVS
jgi:hypothetical protein